MDDLAAIIHSLKAPVANIKLAIKLLKSKDDRNQKYLDMIDLECDRQILLIEDLLLAEKLKEWKVDNRPILLRFWFYRLVEQHKSLGADRGLVIRFAIERTLEIHADSNALEAIFAELLRNACKYTPVGGEIKISATRSSIAIANRGYIPEKDIPRIFDRFYRVPGGDPDRQGGSGLGLAIVKRVVELLGYSIACHCADGWIEFRVDLDDRHR